jgi:TfoX/Sxy family transcriptional regulator of competence genes
MAYDHDLADRVREQLPAADPITQRQMFGGLAFLLAGNMSVGIMGDELIVRVGRESADEALAQPHARPFDFTGRPMTDWVMVAADGIKTDRDLAAWVERGVAFARSLPPK